MADKDEPVEGQEPEPTEGQEPTPSGGQDSPETFDREYVEKLRREAASYRTELKDIKAKLEEKEQEEMSERERLQARLDKISKSQEEAEAALRQERARVAIVKAAAKVGLPPELAEKLVEVEFDEDGQPVNVEEAVKKLAKEYPQLVKTTDNGAPTNPARRKTTLTPEDVKKMTSEEINARWEEVQEVLAGK